MKITYYKNDKLDITRTALSYSKYYLPIIGDKIDQFFTQQ